MADQERLVAGLRCREVLALLSEYVDGSFTTDQVEQIRQHLAGCDWCERFGSQFGEAIAALKENLGEPEPIPRSVRERLRDRLTEELSD